MFMFLFFFIVSVKVFVSLGKPEIFPYIQQITKNKKWIEGKTKWKGTTIKSTLKQYLMQRRCFQIAGSQWVGNKTAAMQTF